MDKHGCLIFVGQFHNRGLALASKIAIIENENMPYCPGGNDEYIHISEIDYIIEGSKPIYLFYAAISGSQPKKNAKLPSLLLRK